MRWISSSGASSTLVPGDLRIGLPHVERLQVVHPIELLPFDSGHGQFAGERDTLRADSRSGLRSGTVISTTAVRVAVVDRAGARP